MATLPLPDKRTVSARRLAHGRRSEDADDEQQDGGHVGKTDGEAAENGEERQKYGRGDEHPAMMTSAGPGGYAAKKRGKDKRPEAGERQREQALRPARDLLAG